MVNYNDIASLAKVSSTTVSHVINETRYVSPDTKKRVLDAMKKLNYQPNLLARGLATGKTRTVGLVISDIKNPFYPELVQGVEQLALSKDYNIFLCNTDYDIEKGLKSTQALIRKKVDGIIVASSQAEDFLIKELLSIKIPFVLVDWNKTGINVDSIYFDFKTGIEEAINHLLSLGHKKIFFISGPKNLNTARIRKNNFIEIMDKYEDSNLTYKIFEGNHKLSGGFECAERILKANEIPTAIICSNDITAIGVMKTLHENNIKVPQEISIVGLDNISLTEIVSPALTTIALERYEIGKASMEMLLNRIKDKDLPKQIRYFKTRLIVRRSTQEI
jgi:DNA-binding LacI/PurR family transcriptional regulator